MHIEIVEMLPDAASASVAVATAYAKALRDGVSASFPAAPLVANALLEATGVLTEQDTIALMPDDPALFSAPSAALR
jgi:Ethanolamine utilization protein EutJ (predicted chaperonin)